MFKFTADYLIKQAWSKAIKNEITTLCQGKPAYPRFPEDEAELDATLTTLESFLPPNLGTKVKPYMIYLCKQYFQANPAFNIGTNPVDEDGVREALTKHKEKYPTGPDSDCGQFRKPFNVVKREANGEEEEGAEDKYGFTPEDMEFIRLGSTSVASVGGWELFKFDKKAKGQQAVASMGRACNHAKTGCTWCTGEDAGAGAPNTNYINQGPFYVAQKGGKTRWAFAHQTLGSNGLDLINLENVVIWKTGDDEAKGHFPNLEAVGTENNIPFDFSTISAIPSELVPLIEEAGKHDSHIAEMIPIPPPFDKEQLKAILVRCPQDKLVEDWNKNGSSDKGKVQIIMGISIDARQDLKEVYNDFTTETLNNYIISLAAAGYDRLPPSLEDFIVENF